MEQLTSGVIQLPELVRLVGRGSYGEVWLGRTAEQTWCAVKIVSRQSFESATPYEREFLGIQKFAPLSRSYDSQLRIFDVGRDDREGFFFYVMELADDEQTGREINPEQYVPRTLRSELRRRGRLPLDECITIGLTLSAALENLRQNGLIHRDVKPSNVVFVDGSPKLADIGLVTDSDVTVSFVGTEGFIPPEGPGSPQADIYSLGKVLYEISTGRDRQNFPELPTSIAESPNTRFLELNAILARCCHPDPRQRYATARQVYSDLALLQRGGSIRLKRSMRRNVVVALWAGGAALASFALAVLYFLFSASSQDSVLFQRHSRKADATRSPTETTQEPTRTPFVIPLRSLRATPKQLDLTTFYNAQLDSPWHNKNEPRLTLEQFPAGLVQFGNVSFDARGIVQLSGTPMARRKLSFPKSIAGIPVGNKARRLHFLHGSLWSAADGTPLGNYIIHYADHQQHAFPIVYGEDLRDWNIGSDPKQPVSRGTAVWAARQGPYAFRIYRSTWTNPLPDLEITAIDFSSENSSSAPFLLAITFE